MFTLFLTVLDAALIPRGGVRAPAGHAHDLHDRHDRPARQKPSSSPRRRPRPYEAPARDLAQSKSNRRSRRRAVAPVQEENARRPRPVGPDRMHCVTWLQVLPALGRTKAVSTGLDGVLSVANLENWSGASSVTRCPVQRQGLNSFATRRGNLLRNGWYTGLLPVERGLVRDNRSPSGHKASVVDVINDDFHQIISARRTTVKVWDIRTCCFR